jgi:hypothetical protein
MRDPLLDEARARQRRTLRTIDDTALKGWRPPAHKVTGPAKADRPFAEIALRRAADELAPALMAWFTPLGDLHYADTAIATLQGRPPTISFEQLLAALAQTKAQATDQLERLRVDDNVIRWINLVVWADELADDGYCDLRLS